MPLSSVLDISPLKAGMTVSNEPGFYADGRFGIRIENIVLVRDAKTSNNFGDKGYLCFEHVTMRVLVTDYHCVHNSDNVLFEQVSHTNETR